MNKCREVLKLIGMSCDSSTDDVIRVADKNPTFVLK
jgi:hypothetical protein